MAYIVDNAIIMAAGQSSRFLPLSIEKPKALIEVRGEVLIERQIKQLIEVGINEIYIVVGYKKELFYYLEKKYGVTILENAEYRTRNNNSSIYTARKVIKNSYICSADNYFVENPFEKIVDDSYYSTVYVDGKTNEWCIQYDSSNYITSVEIGGKDSWVMLGHVFWSSDFSEKFLKILEKEYNSPDTYSKFWENIYIENIDELKMKIRKYDAKFVFEFDSLDELRDFDDSYISDTRSKILKEIAKKESISERYINRINVVRDANNSIIGFTYYLCDKKHIYYFEEYTL